MTFTTPYVNIDGLPSAVPTQVEYTSGQMASAYYNAILAFVDVLRIQKTANVSAGNVTQINSALALLSQLARYGVIVTGAGHVIFPNTIVSAGYLASKGLTTQSPPPAGQSSYKLSYMTMAMAQDYNAILQSLGAVGVSINTSPQLNLTQLQQWADLAIQVSAIGSIVTSAQLEGYGGASTLQTVLDVNYIQAGNTILVNSLSQLQKALGITQDSMSNLTELQNLKNNLAVGSSAFNFDYAQTYLAGGPSAWAAIYQSAASAYYNKAVTPYLITSIDPFATGLNAIKTLTQWSVYFNKALTSASLANNTTQIENLTNMNILLASLNHPGTSGANASSVAAVTAAAKSYNIPLSAVLTSVPNWSKSGYINAVDQLVSLRNQLSAQVAELSGMSSTATLNNSNSLYSRLKTVLGDINSVFVTANGQPITSAMVTSNPSACFSGFFKWMIDNYSAYTSSSGAGAGTFQQDISFAITAAENLNSSQTEQVQNYMFLFQEYYQSASSALQQITQIIQQIAKNISQ